MHFNYSSLISVRVERLQSPSWIISDLKISTFNPPNLCPQDAGTVTTFQFIHFQPWLVFVEETDIICFWEVFVGKS